MLSGKVANVNLFPQTEANSRYRLTPITTSNGEYVYELFRKPDMSVESEEDMYHVVQVGEANRLDLIAYQYYNDARYWWLLASANNMIDPFVLVVGSTIRVPSLNSYYVANL